jgi:hypothetical protein
VHIYNMLQAIPCLAVNHLHVLHGHAMTSCDAERIELPKHRPPFESHNTRYANLVRPSDGNRVSCTRASTCQVVSSQGRLQSLPSAEA